MTAKASGTFTLGGDLTINRMGFGAMRITGKGIWGEPADHAEALRVLQRLPALDVNFIDTADAYGPDVSEDLICEALHPYDGLIIATKGGHTRQGPDRWTPVGRPEYLRQAVLMSMRRLKLERIDLWQLHRIDQYTDRDVQFAAIAQMQREGLIRHVGLSEVTVEEIQAAQKHFPVASVQNMYNMTQRQSEPVLDYCEQHNIGFIPWRPVGGGGIGGESRALQEVATRLGATPLQVSLAWLLKRSPVMIPIPGTSTVKHLEENVAAADLELSDEDFRLLDGAAAHA
ncbi:MAG: aldo/keto reductase [Anaerolineae bacterium]|nr:aldo/keto reductase [Anaerolineae bacterium]